jgi:hypothetical protein
MLDGCLERGLCPPSFRFEGGGVEARLSAEPLAGEPVQAYLRGYGRLLLERMEGSLLSEGQERVLAYLASSTWISFRGRYPLLLTGESRHASDARELERWGVLRALTTGQGAEAFFVPERLLVERDFEKELAEVFGPVAGELDTLNRAILAAVFRYAAYSRRKTASGRDLALLLWNERGPRDPAADDLDGFCLRIRQRISRLKRAGFLVRAGEQGYRLNPDYQQGRLF